MTQMISPNEALQHAKDLMLEGAEPETREDWEKVMNCLAFNIHPDVSASACKLLARIYRMPLQDWEIEEICQFQKIQRAREDAKLN